MASTIGSVASAVRVTIAIGGGGCCCLCGGMYFPKLPPNFENCYYFESIRSIIITGWVLISKRD